MRTWNLKNKKLYIYNYKKGISVYAMLASSHAILITFLVQFGTDKADLQLEFQTTIGITTIVQLKQTITKRCDKTDLQLEFQSMIRITNDSSTKTDHYKKMAPAASVVLF